MNSTYLSQVVKVVLSSNPFEVCLKTIRLIGDVFGVATFTMVKLSFEELYLIILQLRYLKTPHISVEKHVAFEVITWTPRMPKTIKKAQQISTMFPMGLRDVIRVSTTSFSPGARLITLFMWKNKDATYFTLFEFQEHLCNGAIVWYKPLRSITLSLSLTSKIIQG